MTAALKVSEKALKQRIRYKTHFDAFARDCLTIRPKDGDSSPLVLNQAQLHIHQKIEAQYRETGKVRAVIVKGRQQGSSTYVEGRFYWKTIHRKGVRSFILAHDRKSSSTIYEMAQRFHDHCPQALKPSTGTSNAKELLFNRLDSGYSIGTAGNDSVGRGSTIQYFHGSEVAYWPQKGADELTKGILEAVPDLPDTEVILESTGNGVGNYFHQQALSAMRGDGDYILIFVPWYWQEEYTRPIPIDYQRTDEEQELLSKFASDGLTDENLVWRRAKIVALTTNITSGEVAFRQEYPFTVLEAFQQSDHRGMIKAPIVEKARKCEIARGNIVIAGVDPSRGGDRFGVMLRAGRKMYGMEAHGGEELTLGRKVQICKRVLDEDKPLKMFVDAGGGADLVDRLKELGYGSRVTAVPFGGAALNPKRWKNRRAEMWGLMNDWLCDETLDVQIPDSDDLQADLTGPRASYDSMDRIVLESKDAMQDRGIPSPDLGDAAALTFAEIVTEPEDLSDYRQPAHYFE